MPRATSRTRTLEVAFAPRCARSLTERGEAGLGLGAPSFVVLAYGRARRQRIGRSSGTRSSASSLTKPLSSVVLFDALRPTAAAISDAARPTSLSRPRSARTACCRGPNPPRGAGVVLVATVPAGAAVARRPAGAVGESRSLWSSRSRPDSVTATRARPLSASAHARSRPRARSASVVTIVSVSPYRSKEPRA